MHTHTHTQKSNNQQVRHFLWDPSVFSRSLGIANIFKATISDQLQN